eukprot:5171059-Amphidinium_carterae.2
MQILAGMRHCQTSTCFALHKKVGGDWALYLVGGCSYPLQACLPSSVPTEWGIFSALGLSSCATGVFGTKGTVSSSQRRGFHEDALLFAYSASTMPHEVAGAHASLGP